MTGEEVRKIRKALGMSPQYFSAILGVSPSTVYRWESSDTIRVESMQLQILTLLRECIVKPKKEQACLEFGSKISTTLLVNGSLFALYEILREAYE